MADDPKKIAAEKQKIAAQKAKIKAEKLHQKRMENDAKYRHDYEIESKKQWRETRRENSAKEQEILDQKSVNERNWTDMRAKDLHEATKKRKEAEDAYRADLNESKAERSKAGELAEKLQQEKESVGKSADAVALEKQLDKLGGVLGSNSTEQSNALISEFKSIKGQLDNPDLNPLEREVLNAELDQIAKGADAEEERREKQKEVEDSQSVLLRIANGTNKMAAGFDSFRDGLLKGGGIIAALGAIALIFFDPETLMKGVTIALEKINEIVAAVGKIIDGDWKGGLNDLLGFAGDNKLIIAGVALLFGGSILRGLGSMFTTAKSLSGFIGKVSKVIKTVSLALRAAALASATAMGSMLTGMIAFLAPFAIPIAIAAGIALIVAGIGYALTKLRDALGFTSVFDVIMLGVAYLKDGFAHVGNVVIDIYNKIMDIIGGFASWLGFDLPDLKMKRLSTDNAERKKTELEEKARAEAAEKAKAKEIEEHEVQNELMGANFNKLNDGVPSGVNIGPMSEDELNQIEILNSQSAIEEASGAQAQDKMLNDLGVINVDPAPLNRLQAVQNKKILNAEKLMNDEADLATAREKAGVAAATAIVTTNQNQSSVDNSSRVNVINNFANPGASTKLTGGARVPRR